MVKIDKKIVGYSVVKDEVSVNEPKPVLIERSEVLPGRTYKVKTPLSESALYITINHCELNGVIRPFEIFINSKDMKHFQWVVALTRLISAVFRHGGEVSFLIDELRSVLDPNGGAFHKGKYIPSLVSVIGDVIEQELTSLGLYQRDDSLKEAAVAMVKEKTLAQRLKDMGAKDHGLAQHLPLSVSLSDEVMDDIRPNKKLCDKCNEYAVVMDGGCETCHNCGFSRCS
jgi:hypothetical protein